MCEIVPCSLLIFYDQTNTGFQNQAKNFLYMPAMQVLKFSKLQKYYKKEGQIKFFKGTFSLAHEGIAKHFTIYYCCTQFRQHCILHVTAVEEKSQYLCSWSTGIEKVRHINRIDLPRKSRTQILSPLTTIKLLKASYAVGLKSILGIGLSNVHAL